MRLIIAGSRHIPAIDADRLVAAAIKKAGMVPTTILSGTATGIDAAGERWATANNIPIERHPADWNKHGRAAGPLRNREMAASADTALVIWDGVSRGSKSMIQEAEQRGLKLFVVTLR